MRFSSLTGGTRYCSQSCMYTGHFSFWVMVLGSWVVSLHACIDQCPPSTDLDRAPYFFFSVLLYPLMRIVLWNLDILVFQLSASSPKFRETAGLGLSFSSLCHSLGILSEQQARVIVGCISFVPHLSGITALHRLLSSVLKTAVSLNIHFKFKFKLIQIKKN